MEDRIYIAIDLKSFYASVECADRNLDPLTTNLVVADASRTEKTICLAVSPSLKSYGIGGRARLFEVVRKTEQINRSRLALAPKGKFTGSSCDNTLLLGNPSLRLDYITAPPRMSLYMKKSTEILKIYLGHVAPQDLHVYSVDEVFIDVTPYLHTVDKSPREFAMMLIHEVLAKTGITATAGIGTNLFLCKVAMDIVAKHIPADKDGVRIAELDELSFRRTLWNHTPLTDFWRIGPSTANTLMSHGMYTMGDVARTSIKYENTLYSLFGVNAELLIDHAWGYESCTIKAIKSYRPSSKSISTSQVLHCPYDFEKACIVLKEMADSIALELVSRHLVSNLISVYISYDRCNLTDPVIMEKYSGPVSTDWYGRPVPKSVHASERFDTYTSSCREIVSSAESLFRKIADPCLLVRRLSIAACNATDESSDAVKNIAVQGELFCDYDEAERKYREKKAALEKEKRGQLAVLEIKKKYGKNAILRASDLMEGATAIQRNAQIGGHKA